MEGILARFPHIGEPIFNALDEKSLQNCKIAFETWKRFIEDPNQKQLCIRFIKNQENNLFVKRYISVNQKWSKLKAQDLGEFAKKLQLTKDEAKKEEMFLEKYVDLNIQLNGKDGYG